MNDAQVWLTLLFDAVGIGYSALLLANFVAGLAEQWLINSTSQCRSTDYFPEPEDEQAVAQAELDEYVEDQANTFPWDDTYIISTESSRDYECNPAYDGWRYIEPEERSYENEYLQFLADQSIRVLKKLASARRIKHYNTMNKADLVEEINYWRTLHC